MTDRIELSLERSTGFRLEVDIPLEGVGVTVLFGPSGCGKTTVLRAAAGLERARGLVRVAGQLWQDDAQKIFVPTYARRIGYVFQEASLFAHLTVIENLRYGLTRIHDPQGEKRLYQAVELLGIGHLLQRRATELSGGERQRCAIARSLAIRPTALFMDEPLAALDHARRLEIMPWIERIKNELGLPILYVTHSEEEVLRLADQLVLMEGGSVVARGAVDSVWLQHLERTAADAQRIALVMGTITQKDPDWGLMLVQAGSAHFWVRDTGLLIGSRVRLMIDSANLSVAVQKPSESSIQNIFEASVAGLRPSADGYRTTVTLDAQGTVLLADLTARSAHNLGLAEGMRVWVQIKSVSVF
ncbi:MAG: molybdenum ABC transporter ATP-binding protein [Duodenibacillus sp.]|nr:molybdenum ABC transporter ATP-binding protein [Duodenibacillus sp.]